MMKKPAPKKPMTKAMFEKKDAKLDKKMGIKEDSAKDKKMDAKMMKKYGK